MLLRWQGSVWPPGCSGLDSSLLVCLLPSPLCLTVRPSVGPMARDVESLALCLRALLCEDMFRLDPTVPPLPFREEVSRAGWAWVWTAEPRQPPQGLEALSPENRAPGL